MTHYTRLLIIFVSALVLIFGLVAIVMLNQEKEESWEPNFSTLYTDPFGTHALYRLLDSQGYIVRKNYYSLDKTAHDEGLNYIFIAPQEFLSDTEEIILNSKISAGSWALIVGTDGNNPLGIFDIEQETENLDSPEELAVLNPNEKQPVSAAFPSPLNPDMDSVQFIRNEEGLSHSILRDRRINHKFRHHLKSDSTLMIPLLQSRDGKVEAGWFRYGEGGVVYTTHPYIFTNEGLRNPSNVILVMNLFGMIREITNEPFVFDEYHQGFHIEKIASPIWIPELRWMLWGLSLTFILAIIAGTKRSIRMVPVTQEPRRSILEFISSMAEIYSRKKGNHSLFKEICIRFVVRTKSALGIPESDIVKNPTIAGKAAKIKWDKNESEKLEEILKEIRFAYTEEKPSLSLARKMREFSIRNKLDLNIHVK